MKASILVARLPTKARHSSKRGMPMATPQEISTSIVLRVQIITVYMTFQNRVCKGTGNYYNICN